ncbi:MAG: methyltransferase domain-containing protein [Gammaproteobacteria bacterium]|nr:methyltransferase domain-containing protein [Gammaproteobacteria bacterium]
MKNESLPNVNDFDAYHPEHVPLFEAIYGKNLISLGGLTAIDNMFSDLNIRGLKALDLGFGLGGVAFYLAEKYQMNIAGIEMYTWMVQYAKSHAPSTLSNSLEFNTYDSFGNFPYEPETFELVYSKGVLNHVADKVSLFKQINSVLKSNGLFVIADWIFLETTNGSSAPVVCETKESYEQVLLDTGFSEISFRDDSELFLNYAKELLTRLSNNQSLIKQKYGEELFLIIQKQHEELIEKIQQHQKIATRIVTKKAPY